MSIEKDFACLAGEYDCAPEDSKCNTCARVKSCPFYPADTLYCPTYEKKTNEPTYYYRNDVTGGLQELED